MRKTEIRVEGVEAYFERGRRVARAADRGVGIRYSKVVAFEDVESLLDILTEKRLILLRHVKEAPGSISELAKRLGRDRSAVTRDVQALERFGVIEVTERPLAGHGRQKWVTPVAEEIEVTAVL